MARLSWPIVCLEPGNGMAAVARAKLAVPDIEIVNTTFEDWDPRGARFDLIFAATSWHWIEPAIGYSKAAALLRPGGWLASWSALHGCPDGFDPFFAEIHDGSV